MRNHPTALAAIQLAAAHGTPGAAAPDRRYCQGNGSRFVIRMVITVLVALSCSAATPPSILQQPQNRTAFQGSDTVLAVTVAGDGPFGYEWRQNGRPIVPLGAGGPSLTLSNIQPANAGAYTVLITNAASSTGVLSTRAIVTVLNPPIAIGTVSLLQEGCAPGNASIDPDEIVTVGVPLINTNATATTRLVARLLESPGVASVSPPQTYENLAKGGGTVTQPFSFRAQGSCGSFITLQFQLTDGSSQLGVVSHTARLGPPAGDCCGRSLQADLGLSNAAMPGYLHLPADLHYSLTVSNAGPSEAPGVVVTNWLPDFAALLSANASRGIVEAYSHQVVCRIGTLGLHETVQLEILANPLTTGNMTNRVEVHGTQQDPAPGNNQLVLVTEVRGQGLTIDFDALNTVGGAASAETSAQYLAHLGPLVSVDEQTTRLGIDRQPASVSPPNHLFAQARGSADSISFTLSFKSPLRSFQLTRPMIEVQDALTPGTLTSWEIRGFNSLGIEIDNTSEQLCESACVGTWPSHTLHLDTPGIRSVTVSARGIQPRLPLDELVMIYSPSNVVPQVALTAPTNGAAFRSAAPIVLAAEAGDLDDAVTALAFYSGTELLATLTDPPYRWSWERPPRGYHRVRAIATDARGAVSASSEVTITVDLAIVTVEPLDQRARLGQTARFSVLAVDPGPLSYQWYRNNLPIPGAVEPTLVLAGIGPEDSGDYFAVIDNHEGLARSRTAKLEVIDQAPAESVVRDTPRPDFWVTDGPVASIFETNGVVYVRGAFNNLIHNSGNAGVFDAIDGAHIPGFPPIVGDVRSVVSDNEGGFFVAGYFSVAGSLTGTNLVRIRSDGSLDPKWLHAVDGPVLALALVEDTLFAGGYRLTVDGTTHGLWVGFDRISGNVKPLARPPALPTVASGGWQATYPSAVEPPLAPRVPPVALAPDGGGNWIGEVITLPRPPYWKDSDGVFSSDGVVTMAALGGTLYLGGFFMNIGGEVHHGLAAVDAQSGTVLPWRADLPSSPPPFDGVLAVVNGLLANGDRVYVCGGIRSVNGVPRTTLAALDARTGNVLPFDPVIDGSVSALGFACNSLIIGGTFSQVGGKSRQNLAALDPVTGRTLDWDPRVDGQVSRIATLFNTVYITGDFTKVGSSPQTGFAAIDLTSGLAHRTGISPGRSVMAIAADPKKIWALGNESFSGIPRSGYAAFEARTGLPLNISPSADILELLDRPAELAADCTIPADMDLSNLFKRIVNSSATSGSIVYGGGSFSSLGSVYARHNLAAVRCGGGTEVLPWNPGADGEVFSLHAGQEQLYVGGLFRRLGGRIQPSFAVFPLTGAPSIRTQPRGGTVATNAYFGFSVAVNGSGPFTYQWMRDGTNIAGATGGALEVRSAALTDAGAYSVVVSNPWGSIHSTEARLVVVEPVRIHTHPVSEIATPGSDVILHVGATSIPAPIYQWRINGINIPGADQSTYIIPNADPTNGGSYSVIVANPGGAVRSDPAVVVIQSPPLPFTDNLADRIRVSDRTRLGSGTSTNSTREPGETNHVAKMGGHSVWFSWMAPTNGIATFSTRGSTFDTLLAIYTSTNLPNLVKVAEDEDRGGFATSLTAFNAEAGTEYLVAVDGFAGDSGHIVLSWDLITNTVSFPRILVEPLSQSVPKGAEVTFSVSVEDVPGLGYQWLYNCTEIPRQNTPTLRLRNVQLDQVGLYSVRITNASSRTVESARAVLEVGEQLQVVAQDKFEDLFQIGSLSGPVIGGGPGLQSLSPPGSGTIIIPNATLGSQAFPNFRGGTQAREPNHCGVIGGASKWLWMQPTNAGRIAVHTMGSTIDTVIGVYRLVGTSLLEVACDNDSASDGVRSLARFDASAKTDYFIAVDAVGGVEGIINFHWQMGNPATQSAPAQLASVRAGSPLTLRVQVTATSDPPWYEWRLRDTPLPGATNSTLSIDSVRLAQAGAYSVVLSNLFGVTTNKAATLDVLPPSLHIEPAENAGVVRMSLPSASPDWFSLEHTTNLIDWLEVRRFMPTNAVTNFDIEADERGPQFYRVVPAR